MPSSGPPVDLPLLDESIVRLPEDVRRDVAEQAANDLFGFVRGVLGYRDVTPGCHGPLCTWHDQNPSRYKLTLMPRGHLKTSCITISKTMQRVVKDPERRILLANETATNAERFLSVIKSHAETNRVFRTLYSHVVPKDTRLRRWSQQELEFNREGHHPEPTIDTIGMTGAMTSRHYTDIEVDDPISEEAAKSLLVMRDVIGRLSKIMSLMVDPSRDTFDLTGTRWALFDVYSDFESKLGVALAKFVRAAIEEGTPIWPERFSLKVLGEIRATLNDEYMWSCLYMNRPRNAEAQDFNVQDLRFWRWAADGETIVLMDQRGVVLRLVNVKDLDVTITFDPAGAEKLKDDRNALTTCGSTTDGDVIVLDEFAKRCTPLEVARHLVYLIQRFHPRVLGVESVAYQRSFKYWFQAVMEQEQIYVRVQDLPNTTTRKDIRIRGLQPIAASGHLYILPSMHILRQELAEFPLGQFDDVADSLAMHLQLFRGVLSESRVKQQKEIVDRILRRLEYGNDDGEIAALARPDDRGMMPTADDVGFDPEDRRYSQFVDYVMT